jgi:hydroxymethylbilane synthase
LTQTIKIGTRGSQLALWQANYVQIELQRFFPHAQFEQIIIKTSGDRDQKSSLTQIGGQGLFTKTIEDALLAGQIDIAVHSLKDLPTLENETLLIAAVPERGPVEDVLVTPTGAKLDDLPLGAQVATGSIRRRSQLLAQRPDLLMQDLRGNIDTRLRKLETEGWDAIVMAKAAIQRLALTNVKYAVLPVEEMVPAVGQGAIGLQTRADADAVVEMVKALNHIVTFQAVLAERAVLRALDSGCQFPIGAFARVGEQNQMHLLGFVGDLSGHTVIKKSLLGKASEAEQLGKQLADLLIADGAMELIKPLLHETR